MRHFTTRDGLPSNVIYEVYQDSKGFIWLGTDLGISYFDGHQFQNLTTRDGLPDNEVFYIKEDKYERLWVLCYNHKPCYILNGKIYNAANDSLCQQIERAGIAYDHMFFDKNNDFYMDGMRLCRVNKTSITLQCPQMHLLSRFYYFQDKGREYYVDGNGVWQLENCSKKIFIALPSDVRFYSAVDHSLYVGLYNVATQTQEITKLDINGDKISIVHNSVLPERIHNIIQRDNTNLWLCTNKGAILFNTQTCSINTAETLLKNLPINRGLKDDEGNCWFATGIDGLYLLPYQFSYIYNKTTGLADDNISAIHRTASGTLLAGLKIGNINAIKGNKIHLSLLRKTANYNTVTGIQETNTPNEIMVGTDNGLFRLNITTGAYNLISAVAIKNIQKRGDNCLVASTGLAFAYNLKTGKITPFYEGRTTSIAADGNNNVWIGTIEGVLYLVNGIVKKLQQDSLLSQSRISDIIITHSRHIVISTHKNGLFVWDKKTMLHISEMQGLSSNICRRMFLDSNDNIWICTGNGLDKITHNNNFSKYDIYHYTQSDGLQTGNINDIIVENDTLYAATTDGIVIQSIKKAAAAPKFPIRIYITSVETKDSLFNSVASLTLNKNQNALQINYTGISFTSGNDLYYKYVLSGTNADTVYTQLTSANFNTIQPGNYTFLVWAREKNGLWNKTPAIFTFTKQAFFWQTTWFKVIVFVLTGIIIYFLFRWQVQAIRKREKEKTASQKRMMEHEMYALREQINPHFLFNALNSIQHYYSQNDERTANRYMTSFATLIRTTLSHSKTHWLDLATELEMLQKYIELEQMRLKHSFHYEIIIQSDIDPHHVKVPAMLMQPYIENAINHGLRHLQERKGLLVLSFSLNNNNLVCNIDDNGIGFKAAAVLKSNSHRHKSMGMDITRKRIETINLLYNTDITVQTIHKEGNKLSSGTCVKLYFPIQVNTDHE